MWSQLLNASAVAAERVRAWKHSGSRFVGSQEVQDIARIVEQAGPAATRTLNDQVLELALQHDPSRLATMTGIPCASPTAEEAR